MKFEEGKALNNRTTDQLNNGFCPKSHYGFAA
jgi:hypothetical protein